MPNFIYKRIRPVDLKQVADDQGAATKLSEAIAAIQAHRNVTFDCPQCKVAGVSTGWNTIPTKTVPTQIICTLCNGYLKTAVAYFPDPQNPGKFITLQVSGQNTVAVNATTQLNANFQGGTWASDNVNIASVNANTGLVTGVAAGNALITYTYQDTYTATKGIAVTA